MSNGLDASAALEDKKLFLERTKFFRDHVQGVLNLATGSLVLSVTFLHNIESNVIDKSSLSKSWAFFVVSILLGIAYNYVLAIHERSQGKHFRQTLSVLSFIFHSSFVVAIYYLAHFGWSNMR